MSEYIKPSLKKELMDKVQKFINDYPELGYRSLAQFIEDAIRRRADELHVFDRIPRFEHFNLNETGVRIKEKSEEPKLIVEIFFKPDGILCDYCKRSDCRHVQFALRVPEIKRVIDKKRREGWKLGGD